jgi:hypothetical protein
LKALAFKQSWPPLQQHLPFQTPCGSLHTTQNQGSFKVWGLYGSLNASVPEVNPTATAELLQLEYIVTAELATSAAAPAFSDTMRYSAINYRIKRVFSKRGQTKRRSTLKPPVVGSHPASLKADKQGPETAKPPTPKHMHDWPPKN